MGDNFPKLKVAAVQAAPVFLNREASIKKACDLIHEAGTNGAKIVVFPETFIPAFPYWFYFYPANHPKCVMWNRELFKNSVVVPSAETDQLCEAAKSADVYVVMGINEKDPINIGTIYNTQIFIHKDGYIIDKHRKLVPTLTERLVHSGGDGSTLTVVDTEYGKLGGLICGENTNPLARFVLYEKGEYIHAASWPSFGHKGQSPIESAFIRIKNYAYEGKVFVISSSLIFSDEMKDILCLSDEVRKAISYGGHSAIVGPTGNFISGPAIDSGETIVYGDIDLEEIIDAKMIHDVMGHYNRFDVLSVNFNPKQQKPVINNDNNFIKNEESHC